MKRSAIAITFLPLFALIGWLLVSQVQADGDVIYVNGAIERTGLIAYWPIDSGSGNSITNFIDGQRSDTFSATWDDSDIPNNGISHHALVLDGINDYIDTNEYTLTDDFTLVASIKPDVTSAEAILDKSADSDQILLGIYNGDYFFRLNEESVSVSGATTAWHQIAVAVKQLNATQSQVTFFKDGHTLGTPVVLDTVVGDISGGKVWSIGQDWDGNNRSDHFDGAIDSVRIYDRALIESELDALVGDWGGAHDGTSWATAFLDPDDAFAVAQPNDEIWIAQGTYEKPYNFAQKEFWLPDGVTVYGGFAGDETLVTQRDWENRPATLENSYSVLQINTGVTAVIDGVNVRGFAGDGSSTNHGVIVSGHLTMRNGSVRDGYVKSGRGGGLNVWDSATLLLDGVTVDNGHGGWGGGALRVRGSAEIHNSILTGNRAGDGYRGGAIVVEANDSILTLTNTLFEDNEAINGDGGAIHNSGTVTVTNSQFIDNRAYNGGAITAFAGDVTVSSTSVFSGNVATYLGGAIWATDGTLSVTDGTFTGNNADLEGGAISLEGSGVVATVTDSDFDGNQTDGNGGAIAANASADLTLTNGKLSNNFADDGGGALFVGSGATATVNGVWFDDNMTAANATGRLRGGGAIKNQAATLIVNNSSFIANHSAWAGGGVHHVNGNGSTTIDNSTFFLNSAHAGGALSAFETTSVQVTNSTIYSNTATGPWAGGFHIYDGTQLTLANTIVANNGGTGDCETNSDGSSVVSQENNLISDDTCSLGSATNQENTDPLLSTLQIDSTTFLPFLLPLDGSPAIDAYGCTGSDKVGTARPQGLIYDGGIVSSAGCDIGAVEVTLATLQTYDSPYDNFFDFMNSTLIAPAHDFRTTEISAPDIGKTTTITETTQSFLTFQDGWHYYRYCAEYGDPAHGRDWNEGCIRFSSLSGSEQQARGGYLDDAGTHRDILNGLLEAFAALQWIDENRPNIPRNTSYDVEQTAVLEMAHIPLIFGNEFMVDALRYSFELAQQTGAVTGAQMLNDEIAELEKARQQFVIASDLFEWMTMQEVGDRPITSYFDAADFQTFAIASEREGQASSEIIRRKRLLAVNGITLLDEIEDAYMRQYLQANLLVSAIEASDLAANADEATVVFLDNGGWQLMNSLEELSNLGETIRANSNLLGYDPQYVPRDSFNSLRDRMGTLGTCDSGTGLVTGGSGELLALLQKECAAGTADREFDEVGALLDDELEQLEVAFSDELSALCGHDSNDPNVDRTRCTGGEMAVNYDELDAAQKAVTLAWQRAQHIPDLIAIEQERAGTIIDVIFLTGERLQALEVANGKLRAYREVTTVTQTNEVWAEGSDPNDPTTGAYWLDFGKDAGNCLLAAKTGGTLGDGCKGQIDNTFGAIGELAGLESEPARIETIEAISDPNELEIAGNQGMMAIREAERDATIEGANSNAEIKRLMLEQSDLLIEYEIAVAQLNRVINERNMLVQRHRRALNEHRRIQGNVAQEFIETPALRIIRDQTAANAEIARERTIHLTYVTLKALEYALLAEPISNNVCGVSGSLFTALYQARTASHLNDILCEMDNISLPIDSFPGNPYPVTISVAEDLWGLSSDNLAERLPYTVSTSDTWPSDLSDCNPVSNVISDEATLRYCLFQERLQELIFEYADVRAMANSTTPAGAGEAIYFNFNAQLENVIEGNVDSRWNIRIAGEDQCAGCGVAVNIQTRQNYTGDSVTVSLRHQGQATYRNAAGQFVNYQPGLTAILGQAIPAGWPQGAATNAALTANINGVGGLVNQTDLTNLSAATTDWRFMLQLVNGDLDVTQIEDFVLDIDTIALTVNRRDVRESRAIQSVTPETVFSDDVIGGTYSGSINVGSPLPLGLFDMGLTITRTGTTLTGSFCGTCTPLMPSIELTGQYTDTITDTFHVQSPTFSDVYGGVAVMRTVYLSGIVYQYGDVMEGTYREVIEGYGDGPLVVEGKWLGNRPMSVREQNAVPTAITLNTLSLQLLPHRLVFVLFKFVLLTLTTWRVWRKRDALS